jgi:pyruvate dehydrogenase E2 component (dihydrolipoamide acetyltransferase)
MPALSPTMEKGNLAKWLKAEGDTVKSGDVLAEIETDKATMEVEAVDEGILAKILVAGGTQDVAVNTPIAIIAADGEDVSAPAPEPKKATPQPAAPDTKDATAEPIAAAPASPVTPAAVSAPAGQAAPLASSGGNRVFASPLARRIAKDKGLDLTAIKGSGPHGRIIQRDVEAATPGAQVVAASPVAAATAPAASAPTPAPLPVAGASDAATLKMYEPGSFEAVPHDGMRKTIAKRLIESKLTIPHFYLTVDVDLDALLKLREELNAAAPVKDGKPAYKLSVNDFIIKAQAVALQRVPDANATWTEAAMLKHKSSDVGVAVSIPGGLITPIIRKAETKTLSVISNEMKDLAARARAKKLRPDEYQGGTTAVSNLGMFGIKEFAAIINPPHASILAVGAGSQRAVVRGGQIVVANQMTVTLSVDHRAVDGALGAELLGAFREAIEKPLGLLV